MRASNDALASHIICVNARQFPSHTFTSPDTLNICTSWSDHAATALTELSEGQKQTTCLAKRAQNGFSDFGEGWGDNRDSHKGIPTLELTTDS